MIKNPAPASAVFLMNFLREKSEPFFAVVIVINFNQVYSKIFRMQITWDDFEKIDIRVGTIIQADDFPKAKKPAYRLRIDFGAEAGIKKSSAQITAHYKKEDLLNRQVVAVVNFPPKQIADFISECLVLGIYDGNNDVILLQPERSVMNGHKIG
jgi:tRNA-binding protein